MRSPLARARGLGATGEGLGHWWAQRMSALALIPLTIWFVVSMIALIGADYQAARDWAGSPVVAGLLILFIVATFHHTALGLQVVIEDYVHDKAMKLAAIISVNALAIILGLACVLAVLVVLFGG